MVARKPVAPDALTRPLTLRPIRYRAFSRSWAFPPLIGQQELIGAIDAVCAQASRIIGRLQGGAISISSVALLSGTTKGGGAPGQSKMPGREAVADAGAKRLKRARKPVSGRGASKTTRGVVPTLVDTHPDKTTRRASGPKRRVSTRTSAASDRGKAHEDAGSADAPGGDTPLHIPFGNKEIALQLGARYRTGGWYAPPGVDLASFRQRGWL